jgi:hypothetical protein
MFDNYYTKWSTGLVYHDMMVFNGALYGWTLPVVGEATRNIAKQPSCMNVLVSPKSQAPNEDVNNLSHSASTIHLYLFLSEIDMWIGNFSTYMTANVDVISTSIPESNAHANFLLNLQAKLFIHPSIELLK